MHGFLATLKVWFSIILLLKKEKWKIIFIAVKKYLLDQVTANYFQTRDIYDQ